MTLSSVLQRTLHMLSPWNRHWLQQQHRSPAVVEAVAAPRPTTIQLKAVETQARFVAQRQQTERFAGAIVARQLPKPIVNTIRREPQPSSVQPPVALLLAGSRPFVIPGRSTSLVVPAQTGMEHDVAPASADPWALDQPQPTVTRMVTTPDAAPVSRESATPLDKATPAELAAQPAQHPQLFSVAEEVERRIQRAAAIRRGEVVAVPAETADFARQTTAPFAPTPVAPANEQSHREPSLWAGEPTAYHQPLPEAEAALPTGAPATSPAVTESASSVVAEIQRRINQAAQARLTPSTPAQSQPQSPSGAATTSVPMAPAPAASSPTPPKLPPQVRRMRAMSQIEEIGSQHQAGHAPLPLAVPATPADFTPPNRPDTPLIQPAPVPTPATAPAIIDNTTALRTDAPLPLASTSGTDALLPTIPPADPAPSAQEQTVPTVPTIQRAVTPVTVPADVAAPPMPTTEGPMSPQSPTVLPAQTAIAPSTPLLSSPLPVAVRTAAEAIAPMPAQESRQVGMPDAKVEQAPFIVPNVTEVVMPVPEPPSVAEDAMAAPSVQRSTVEPNQPASAKPPLVDTMAPAPVQEPVARQTLVVPSSAPSTTATATVEQPAAQSPAVLVPEQSIIQPQGDIQRQPAQAMSSNPPPPSPVEWIALHQPPASNAVVQAATPVAYAATDSQSALAMPLAASIVPQRQPLAGQIAATTPSTNAAVQRQPFRPPVSRQDAPTATPLAQPANLLPSPWAGPNIERRIDLSALPSIPSLQTGLPATAPPTIQRQQAEPPAAQLAGLTATETSTLETPPFDLDALAREIMPMVKRLLSVEREREPLA